MFNSLGQCNLCKKEYTSMRVEYTPGLTVYVCPACMEKTKDHFVWLCTSCGKAYFKPKDLVIQRLENSGLEHASELREGVQLIMGLDICIACNPEGIAEYVRGKESELEMDVSEVEATV